MFTYGLILLFFVIVIAVVVIFIRRSVAPLNIAEMGQMIESGKVQQAVKKLTDIIEKDDKNSEAHYFLAQAYEKENNPAFAIIELRKVLKLGHFTQNIRPADVHYRLVQQLKATKNYPEVRKELFMLTQVDPSNFEPYYELGELFLKAGQTDKAVKYLKEAISCNNKHEQSYFLLGQINYKSGLFGDAKKMFSMTVQLNPENYTAHYYLGLCLRQQTDIEEAVREFDIAQKDDSLRGKCLFAKGSCFMYKGQFPQAIAELRKGINVVPAGSEMSLNMMYLLASIYEKIRDIQEAVSLWEKISARNREYRDVADKLRQFADLSQDDRIKDFLIANDEKFSTICRKIVENMDLIIISLDMISDTDVEIVATDSDPRWRNSKQSNRIIRIIRNTDMVPDSYLTNLHEQIRSSNASKGIIISSGEFSAKSRNYVQTHPIELFAKHDLALLLRKIN